MWERLCYWLTYSSELIVPLVTEPYWKITNLLADFPGVTVTGLIFYVLISGEGVEVLVQIYWSKYKSLFWQQKLIDSVFIRKTMSLYVCLEI